MIALAISVNCRGRGSSQRNQISFDPLPHLGLEIRSGHHIDRRSHDLLQIGLQTPRPSSHGRHPKSLVADTGRLDGVRSSGENTSDSPAPVRPRSQLVSRFPSSRRLVTAAVRAGRRIMPMHGLLEVDVTEAWRRLTATTPHLSLTAFVIASVGRAAGQHPEVHAYRDWRGRLVQHTHVDLQTLVEIATDEGPFGLVHVVRDADIRSVEDISAELQAVKRMPTSTRSARLLERLAPTAARVPGLFRAMYAALSRSKRLRRATGTAQVTAIGMFAAGAGFALAPPTLASCTVVVGGLARRPWVVDDRVVVRDVLDLTVTIDHNVVDGGPATRFGADLRRILESAAVFGEHPRQET